ncbi:MAG TPA: hypothetical protein VMY76_00810 [Gemmatimonadales bacterium]|nr:hypothetical protein [Gemmatimonadales bacterium]
MSSHPTAATRPQREWPLLCADSVVRNILPGAQTQDRRPVVFSRRWAHLPARTPVPTEWRLYVDGEGSVRNEFADVIAKSPVDGDLLWVREAHAFCPKSPLMERWSHTPEEARVLYRADGKVTLSGPHGIWSVKWRPNIHMPRWACRLVKPIVRSFVERIQEISESDAIAEGVRLIELRVGPGAPRLGWTSRQSGEQWTLHATARDAFRFEIWEPLYPGSWERNDWVGGVEWTNPLPGVGAHQ